MSKRFLPKGLLLPLCFFIITFTLTLAAWVTTKKNIYLQDYARFQNIYLEVENEIASRMTAYINALDQTRSMFLVYRKMDSNSFKEYVSSMRLLDQYPGIQGIGFARRNLEPTLPSFVWPQVGQKDSYPIVMLEPADWRNRKAMGYDMFTEPIRRKAMEEARDSGLAVMSGTVELVQESGKKSQPGFLIYLPLYDKTAPKETIEQRRKALLGFIYSPFRANDLFSQVFSNIRRDLPVDIEIFMLNAESKPTLLFDLNDQNADPFSDAKYFKKNLLEVAQRKWLIQIHSLPEFSSGFSKFFPLGVLLGGFLISFLLSWIIWKQNKHSENERHRAEQLMVLNRITRNLSAELDVQKLVQSVTDAGLMLSGAEFGAFFYTSIDSQKESLVLYTLAGASKDSFKDFPMPRNTEVFAPTFKGKGTVISEDITKEEFFGKNSPYLGFPEGHLPLKSYLAVSVITRSGEVVGGLFYGHARPGVFTEREQVLIEGLAAQAAIAFDNAKLFKKANEAIQVRDEFLSIASHELKTPITSMKLQTQMAKRMIDTGNEAVYSKTSVDRRVNTANLQLDRMSKLIDDMLDSSRISSSQLTLNFEPIDLQSFVMDVVSNFSEQLNLMKIQLVVHKSQDSLLVSGDKFRLEQVISNLISNAIKYGSGNPIEVSSFTDNGEACVSIKDNGMGIPEGSLNKIFHRFERAVSSKNISGLGLGLYISQKIVENHHGRLTVQSEEGVGSTFTLHLPLINT